MYRLLTILVPSIFLVTSLPLCAQQPNLRHYSSQDGLPQSQVLAITQDATGYIWMGNYGGLSRYDGAEFLTWTAQDGLPSNTIDELAAAEDGTLAFGSANDTFCVLDTQNESREEESPWFKLPGAGWMRCTELGEGVRISGLAFSTDSQTLWAATNRGLYRYQDSRLQRFDLADGLPSIRCRGIAVDAENLWVATDRGLVRRPLAAPGGRFEPIAPFVGVDVLAIDTAERGFYVATSNGLALVDGGRTLWAPLDSVNWSEPHALAVTEDNTVWVATHAGVVSWSADEEVKQIDARHGFLTDVTHDLVVDQEELIWVATDLGATKLIPGPFLTYGTAEGAPNPLVRALAEDEQGKLWIGTRDGIGRLDGERFAAFELAGLSDPRAYALEPSDGGVWVGTRSGLVYWRDGIKRVIREEDGLPSSYATALLMDLDGESLWVGTNRGLALLQASGLIEKIDHPLLEGIHVISMHRGPRDHIWIGLLGGGARMLKVSIDRGVARFERVKAFDASNGLSDMSIWSIDHDKQGDIWVGSNGDGAFRIRPDESIENIRISDGLVDDFIWQVTGDSNGGVWFYSNKGLNQLDADGSVNHYDLSDGLPDLEGMATAALEDSQGYLWFGTSRGVVRYDPTKKVEAVPPPVVRIHELRSQRLGQIQPGDVISSDAGLITASFTALTFRDEEDVRFRYLLDGTGKDWSKPIADRSLSFAGLGAGNHRLKIQAMNGDGLWSTESAVFEFEIQPALWQLWPFRLGALAGVLAIVWSAIGWRTRKLESERRRLEELVAERTLELKNKNRHLEEQIEQVALAEMERQRLEERLRQSEKMEAVGRLAGGVAHDFNNLLTTISGFGELLSEKLGKTNPHQRDVHEILGAAQRAARLTQQLLAFGRKQVIAPQVWSLNELVAEIARMLERLLGENIELKLELEAQSDTVRCDRGQLEQVILNLAVNARDAMPRGGQLIIRTRLEALLHHGFGHLGQEITPGSYVVLEVIDDGPGIEPGLLEHIFEPFFTTKETGHGTGLGLATVYGVVQQNEGGIDVDTELGRGTRFIVRLPHVEALPNKGQGSGSMPLMHIGRQKNTVLVVEDEPTVRRLICGILQKYGYQVIEASEAKEAFALAHGHQGPIHLLLTDVIMPEVDGRAVAERLSRERKDLKILFVSGYPDDYLGARGILPEKHHFLNKPFTPKKLIKKVRAVLDEKPV